MVLKGVPPVIPSYLTVTAAVPFIMLTIVVISIMSAGVVDGCVVAVAIGVALSVSLQFKIIVGCVAVIIPDVGPAPLGAGR